MFWLHTQEYFGISIWPSSQDTILTEGIVAAPSTVTEICKDHRCPRPFTRILPLAIGDHEEHLRHDRLPELACYQQDHMAKKKKPLTNSTRDYFVETGEI